MPTDAASTSKLERVLLFAVCTFFAVAIPYTAMNQYRGPHTEATGIVESSGVLPTDGGPMPELAKVRLADGSLVQALVVSGGPANVGHVAHMRVYRRALSGAAAYEIHRTERPQ